MANESVFVVLPRYGFWLRALAALSSTSSWHHSSDLTACSARVQAFLRPRRSTPSQLPCYLVCTTPELAWTSTIQRMISGLGCPYLWCQTVRACQSYHTLLALQVYQSSKVSCDSPISDKQVVCDMPRPNTQLTGSPDGIEFKLKNLIHPG